MLLQSSKFVGWPLTAKLLLALASTVILGSEPHRTHDHVSFLSTLEAFVSDS
jgi:hypothetical protein